MPREVKMLLFSLLMTAITIMFASKLYETGDVVLSILFVGSILLAFIAIPLVLIIFLVIADKIFREKE